MFWDEPETINWQIKKKRRRNNMSKSCSYNPRACLMFIWRRSSLTFIWLGIEARLKREPDVQRSNRIKESKYTPDACYKQCWHDTNMKRMLSQGKCLKLSEEALENGLYDLLLDIAPGFHWYQKNSLRVQNSRTVTF